VNLCRCRALLAQTSGDARFKLLSKTQNAASQSLAGDAQRLRHPHSTFDLETLVALIVRHDHLPAVGGKFFKTVREALQS
jgi:hypothetical protein